MVGNTLFTKALMSAALFILFLTNGVLGNSGLERWEDVAGSGVDFAAMQQREDSLPLPMPAGYRRDVETRLHELEHELERARHAAADAAAKARTLQTEVRKSQDYLQMAFERDVVNKDHEDGHRINYSTDPPVKECNQHDSSLLEEKTYICDAHFCMAIGDGVVTTNREFLQEECDDFGMFQQIVDVNGIAAECEMFTTQNENEVDTKNWNRDPDEPENTDGCTNNATIAPSHMCTRLKCDDYSKNRIMEHPNSTFFTSTISADFDTVLGQERTWNTIVSACEYDSSENKIASYYLQYMMATKECDPADELAYREDWLCKQEPLDTPMAMADRLPAYYSDAISTFTVCWGCGNGVREKVNDTTTDLDYHTMYLSRALYDYPRASTDTYLDYDPEDTLLPHAEACDDGNMKSGDGCSGCNFEPGGEQDDFGVNEYHAELNPEGFITNSSVYGMPFPWACSCTPETYGTYFCPTVACRVEEGWVCRENENSTSFCKENICGNGFVQNLGMRKENGFGFYLDYENGEECDDANDIDGDGCTNCKIDLGYDCTEVDNYNFWQTAEYFQLDPSEAKSVCTRLPRFETPTEEVIALVEWYNTTKDSGYWINSDGWAEALDASGEVTPILCQNLTNLPTHERPDDLIYCFDICNFTEATVTCETSDVLLLPINVSKSCWDSNATLLTQFEALFEEEFGFVANSSFLNFTDPLNYETLQYWIFPKFMKLDERWAEFDNATGNMTLVFKIDSPEVEGKAEEIFEAFNPDTGSFISKWWYSVFPEGEYALDDDGKLCYMYVPVFDNITAANTCDDLNITYHTYHKEWCDNCCQGNETLFPAGEEDPYYYESCDDFWYLSYVGRDDMELCWENRSNFTEGQTFWQTSNCTVDVCNVWEYDDPEDIPPFCHYWMNYRHFCGRPWREEATTPIFVVTYGGRGSAISRGTTLGKASIGLPKDPCGYCRDDEQCDVWYGLECNLCLNCQGLYDRDRESCLCDSDWVVYGTMTNVSGDLIGFDDTTIGTVHVTSIYMKENNMSGTIPALFSNLEKLTDFYMNDNNIEAFHPETDWRNFDRLRKFYFRNNNLTGSLPAGFKYLTALQELYLDGNTLTSIDLDGLSELEVHDVYPYQSLCKCKYPYEDAVCAYSLEIIDLANNEVGGIMPYSFTCLPNLKYIDLRNNKIDTFISYNTELHFGYDFWFTESMEYVNLENNNIRDDWYDIEFYATLEGGRTAYSIEKFVGVNDQINYRGYFNQHYSLENLKELLLGGNHITGTFPEAIRLLTGIEDLFLEGMGIGGSIPMAFGELRSLKTLNLRNNSLIYTLPNNFVDLVNLEYVDISNNRIEFLPETLDGLDKIEYFNASHNLLQTLPGDLGDELPLLKELDVSNNLLKRLPQSLRELDELEALYVQNNDLDGTEGLPDFSRMDSLVLLDLSNTKLTGTLSENFGLSNIRQLDLHNNAIEGTLPTSITTSERLIYFDASHNKFTMISDTWEHLLSLQTLKLNNNFLEQTLPASLGYLKSLIFLDLSNNRFKGDIPESFGNLLTAESIALQNNNLGGTLPNTIGASMTKLLSLDLSNNGMTGSLPAELFQMPEMTDLKLGGQGGIGIPQGNKFTGFVPKSICEIEPRFTIDINQAGMFWCPFPCFVEQLEDAICLNCKHGSTGELQTCQGDEPNCVTCSNRGTCNFGDVSVSITTSDVRLNSGESYCQDYTGLFSDNNLDLLTCPNDCSGHGNCEQAMMYLPCVSSNCDNGRDGLTNCTFVANDQAVTDILNNIELTEGFSDSLRTGWDTWIVNNFSMYQNPLDIHRYPLLRPNFQQRYDPSDDSSKPKCRKGTPLLDDGSVANSPVWKPAPDDINVYSEPMRGTEGTSICLNGLNDCYHIKFQVAYCECSTDWGGVSCGINTLQTTSDTVVWISAGERRGGVSWTSLALVFATTIVAASVGGT